MPGLLPQHDEVHISTVFTWDKEMAIYLQQQWQMVTNKPVKIGGPAFNDPGDAFIPGRYLKHGCTITSRGCPNRCSFCFVPTRSGEIRELAIKPGNIILDDNLLACSDRHIDHVLEMLKTQRAIVFNSGLEARRITDKIVEQLRGLRILTIYLAYDTPADKKPFEKAVQKLRKYFTGINHIRCYVLIGYKDDTIEDAMDRLRWVLSLGVLPFAMLYRDEKNTSHSKAWKALQRYWSRPAIFRNNL